ncbi:MAG: chorismate mutase [Clostridiales bacterium]|nr:chorismate mutase [Clostridiales bacterium]
MTELDELRGKIDEIDRQIVALYEERMDCCRQVGLYKLRTQMPILDSGRETEVLRSKTDLVSDPEMKPYVIALFEQIMAQSRMIQTKLINAWSPAKERAYGEYQEALNSGGWFPESDRVIYQGQPGAYGEEATIQFFGEDCDRTPARSFEGVFVAIREGLGGYGVLPIENSSTGSINDVYDLLGKYGCSIVGETVVRVEHCLMGVPGSSLGSITDVYSHEQGFSQCREFLNTFPQWNQNIEANTAASAKMVAKLNDPSRAAIASRRAAKLYGLDILAEKINYNSNNYTRFVVVAEKPRVTRKSDKISVIFTVPHTEGSLHRILSVFAANGLNLLKLESRPIPAKSWEYNFFADFAGNLCNEGMDAVIHQLIDETLSFHILGNYEKSSD